MTAATDHNDDDVALAGEYVLGLLPADDLRGFELRLRDSSDMRRLVVEWDEYFIPLAAEIPEVAPPPAIQARVERRLFGAPRRRWPLPWQGTLAGGIIAAALIVGLMFLTPPDQPDALATHTAQIAAEDRSLLIAATLDDDTGEIRLHRTEGAARAGRSLELWLIPEGADGPISLGLLGDDEVTVLTLAPEQRAALQGAVLAVSDEPEGGSPTGAPTGEVLAVGEISPAA
ncbi:anti-sigma factor [Psychromarinibacter sp. S121]|uniref:anti-sigma factor n=1 Tax=Psychromarinibacter sp. S121 TaxID=3415127 RepID=UPI003C7D1AE3